MVETSSIHTDKVSLTCEGRWRQLQGQSLDEPHVEQGIFGSGPDGQAGGHVKLGCVNLQGPSQAEAPGIDRSPLPVSFWHVTKHQMIGWCGAIHHLHNAKYLPFYGV